MSCRTDRQTDRQTHSSQYFATAFGGDVIISDGYCCDTYYIQVVPLFSSDTPLSAVLLTLVKLFFVPFLSVFRPHCSTVYVDAAYCYNVVCLSVCHDREPCKSGWTDRDAVRVVGSDGCVIKWGAVHICATWQIRLNCPCAAAMRPFCQITVTTCSNLLVVFSIIIFNCISPINCISQR